MSQAPLGHCTPLAWPLPCLLLSPLSSQRGWFRSSHPLAGSLAEEGRWFREFGLGLGRRFGSPGPKDPDGVEACGLAPGLPVSPSYSELGADSASRTQVSKVPVRVGPAARALCTLYRWPLQACLRPILGSSLGLSHGHLPAYLAKQPRGSPGCS